MTAALEIELRSFDFGTGVTDVRVRREGCRK